MENEIENKTSILEKITLLIKEKKSFFLGFAACSLFIIIGFYYLDFQNKKQHKIIAEKYIQAGILLSANDNKKSKIIYKDIIFSENSFYAQLALNNIIENNLEESSEEALNLFDSVEKIKIEKEQKNLIKLKKALYLIKISREDEANNIIKTIISDNSIWKETALEILNK